MWLLRQLAARVNLIRLRTAVVAAVFAALFACSASSASETYDFLNSSPANGATISYADWSAAGSDVTFTIRPDPDNPCGSESYYLELDGARAAQFSDECSVSLKLPKPGRYSWRAILYVFQDDLTIPGIVTTFTIAAEPGSAPSVQALRSHGSRGADAELSFRVKDASGAAHVSFTVSSHGVQLATGTSPGYRRANGTADYLSWRIPRSQPKGTLTFCISANDRSGNKSRPSCNALTVE